MAVKGNGQATMEAVSYNQRHIGAIREARGLAAKLALMAERPGELKTFLNELRELYTQMETSDSRFWVGEIGKIVKQILDEGKDHGKESAVKSPIK